MLVLYTEAGDIVRLHVLDMLLRQTSGIEHSLWKAHVDVSRGMCNNGKLIR
jgi:hypothetical protein